MPNRYIFATASDLLPGFERLECRNEIYYVKAGSYSSTNIDKYTYGKDLPFLGQATHESRSSSSSFIVLEKSCSLVLRPTEMDAEGKCYLVDQLMNPDSIVFQPGGFYGEKIFISGSISSTCTTDASKKLLKTASLELTKGFTRVRSFWVGPEAYTLFQNGIRFVTAGVQSPPEYDLRSA